MTARRTVPARRTWGAIVGYSRAVRVGDIIEVSGTSATTEDGAVIGPGDPYLQTTSILETIATSLRELGSGVEDVVRTRVFLVNIEDWAPIAEAHREMFGATMPACSFVQISGLMLPELLVEIEASAIVGSGSDAVSTTDA